jgi:hypothetical protein
MSNRITFFLLMRSETVYAHSTWEYCNVDDKALLGNDSVKQQWKRSDRCYAMIQHTTTMEAKMFSVWSVRWLYHEYEASSKQQSDNWEVGQFSTSQYEEKWMQWIS